MLRKLVALMLNFLLLAGIVPGLAGCGSPQQKPAPPPVKIGVSFADQERDGNQAIRKAMEERRRREQVDIRFMDAKNDAQEQEKQVDRLIQEEVKAVVLQLADPAAGPEMVEKLGRAGISVVALENLPENTPLDGYVASDQAAIGEMQVRFVEQALRLAEGEAGPGGRGIPAVGPEVLAQLPPQRPLNVVVLQGDRRDQMAVNITAANLAAMEGNPNFNVVRVREHPRWDPRQVPATLAEVKAAADRIDVVLANDSRLALAAVEFLKAGGLEARVLTVGAGADRESSRAIAAGEHDAEVDVMAEMLGQYAFDAAVGLAEADHWQFDRTVPAGDYNIPAKIIPVRLVAAKNIYLLEQRWGKLEQEGRQGGQEGGQEPGSGGGGGQGGEEQQKEKQQQGGQEKTTLRIQTEDGKTLEVEIDGAVKKIEAVEEGGRQQQQQGGGGGQ
ncbi:MAG: substrate-binding domain-containing protein [Bacillota bacterium]